ncbi:molybdopterin oxidoreductase [Planotetraspora thailandica]|uniref:Molybdopterin oxidoreductase n=1 Tax=Planotetraspora thailandica TaxID=487172 RepID=A0A8J3V458_9ACTN|nr:molybdopterin-dependent oxidoreductase [Planotetraspora thailandica]GII57429.1 molybdopterin oxidoreductase [Planotetraspora thailandica]
MPEPIADGWGRRTPYGPPGGVERLAAALPGRLRDCLPAEIGLGSPWPVRVDILLDEGVTEADVDMWVQGVSPVHADALDIAVSDGRVVGLRGSAADRAGHGRLDPGDRHGGHADAGRLTRPLVREGGRLVESDWQTAMGRIVSRSKELLDRPGGWGRFGFYTGGRLLLEEHYTLAVIARAGIGTPHLDGGTRIWAATAAAAFTASFGADGQPGSYTDVDHCDAIALWGHDMGESRVLWERMLDRRLGPRPPAMVAVDPGDSRAAKEADVHLAVRPGTYVALADALLHELIAGNRYDPAYVDAHTVGFPEVWRVVEAYPPKRAAEICGVSAAQIEQAAEILGSSQRLVSAMFQSFYRSNQATAAACQVNNLHLLRGMLGRPGAGVFQMRPSAQHARETGVGGDLPGMRNWDNPRHVEELAELWNVDPAVVPQGPPTHAMQIFRYAEQGSIELLWISAADPAVTLPHIDRVRRTLEGADLFVVVQDTVLTETARLADVVLPAAGWAEKRGTVTGADRTVHLCDKAVEPPGEARPDLDIFLDYAGRMGLCDRDGAPLVGWHDPESAFEAWKACSKGRPCDYTGITYERLRAGGVQWPCTPSSGHGAERLYAGGRFPTEFEHCQTFGHDLATGAEWGADRYRATDPRGRAFLHAAEHEPSPEALGDGVPLYWDPVSKQPVFNVAAVPATKAAEAAEIGGEQAEGVVSLEVSQRLEEV